MMDIAIKTLGPYRDMIHDVYHEDDTKRRHFMSKSKKYTQNDQMDAIGCVADRWFKKVDEWMAQMKKLGIETEENIPKLLAEIKGKRNPFLVAVTKADGSIDYELVRKWWSTIDDDLVRDPTDPRFATIHTRG